MSINNGCSEPWCSYLKAQELNNAAACLIDCGGDFDEAISRLSNAIRLSQVEIGCGCRCQSCSLEGCMTFSKLAGKRQERMDMDIDDDDEKDKGIMEGFIFQRPIRVPQVSMGHPMGLVLPLIITYNLALAHQLSAMKEKFASCDRRRKLQRSLKLYELAYRWQMDEEVQSLGFNMILANNLGEIHRAADNKVKFEKCMHHLLSTMMYVLVVDDEDKVVELDGFFHNTSPFIFSGGCAGAA
eukprot:scaffold1060_cov109-Cylindrotheca_fusiformis.AAC.3